MCVILIYKYPNHCRALLKLFETNIIRVWSSVFQRDGQWPLINFSDSVIIIIVINIVTVFRFSVKDSDYGNNIY